MKSKRVLKCSVGFIAGLFVLLNLFVPRGYTAEKIQLRLTTMFPQTHLHTVLHQSSLLMK